MVPSLSLKFFNEGEAASAGCYIDIGLPIEGAREDWMPAEATMG